MVYSVLMLLLAGVAAAATCPVQELGLNSSVDGTLATSDCRLRDIDTSVRTTAYVNQFRVTLTEKGTLTARLSSDVFNTYLYLYDTNGRALAQNDDADTATTNSRIIMSLPAGKYVLVASSKAAGSTGPFTLAASFEPPRTCTLGELVFGTPADGSLTATTCRTVDLRTPSNDDRPVDRYRLALTKRGVVTITLSSPDFDTYLELYTSQGRRLTSNHGGGGGTTSRILVSLDPGNYVVYAYPWRTATGAYTLKADAEPLRECTVNDLKPGDSPAGKLTEQSCRVLDLRVPSADNAYVDPYRITVTKRSVLALEMTSTSFDTYIMLTDSDYVSVFENDDASDSTTNSRVYGSLDPGTYYLLATTSDIATGDYGGSVTWEEPRACPAKDLGTTDSVTGKLLESSCRVLDLIVPSEDDTPLDVYRVVVDRKGVLSLDMSSLDLSPYIFLVDQHYNSLAELDSQGDVETAGDLLVLPGTYYVLANSYDYGGTYRLTTKFGDPKACPAPAIGLQDAQSGKLAAGGCTFDDVVPYSTGLPALTNQHQVTVTQRGDLTVTVASKDFPPVVVVAGPDNIKFWEFDLNATDGSSAQVTVTLPPGQYNILVLTLVNAAGSYDVTTSFTRAAAPDSD